MFSNSTQQQVMLRIENIADYVSSADTEVKMIDVWLLAFSMYK